MKVHISLSATLLLLTFNYSLILISTIMFNLVFDSKFKTFTFDFIKTNMFNFDSFGNSTFYGDPYCRIGYVYSAPCYYTDNSYSFGYSDNCIPSQAYYTPSAYPFNFTPAYPQPDKDQLKNPTLPTRDS